MSKPLNTRHHRQVLLSRYKTRALESGIKLNYQKVKRLDEKAKENGESFKKAFERYREKLYKSRTYYIKRKFGITKEEARELLNEKLATGKSYKVIYEETHPKEPLPDELPYITTFWEAINMLKQNYEDNVLVHINISGIIEFNGTVEQLKKESASIRRKYSAEIGTESPGIEEVEMLFNNYLPDKATEIWINSL